jgi:hypothetical protein
MLNRNRCAQAIATITAFLLPLLALVVLCACDDPQQSEVSTGVSVPLPVGTVSYPTSTPAPTEPYYTATPLPPPPVAATFPPASEPVPNIAWSAQSDNALAVWVGHYTDSPAPVITGARQVARWTGLRLDLASIAASPDGHSLAVLLPQVCVPAPPPPTATPDSQGLIPPGPLESECEGAGIWPQYVYAIDLITGKVQSIPDYYREYQLYADHIFNNYKVLSWFDNDRFGIADYGAEMSTATKDGLSFIPRPWPNLPPYFHPFSLALLPDHKTIFAWVGDSFFFRDAPTGVVRKVGDRIAGTWMEFMAPSPDGKLVYSLEPQTGTVGNDGKHYGLWMQDLASGSRTMLVDNGVWDTRPAWSPDSSRIAFARTSNIPSGDQVWITQPESADTNIYIFDLTARSTRQVTTFTGAHNSSIQWTPSGNLVLASSAGSITGRTDLAAISTTGGNGGKLTTLISARQGEQLLHPLLFGAGLPGMPGTGADPSQH